MNYSKTLRLLLSLSDLELVIPTGSQKGLTQQMEQLINMQFQESFCCSFLNEKSVDLMTSSSGKEWKRC